MQMDSPRDSKYQWSQNSSLWLFAFLRVHGKIRISAVSPFCFRYAYNALMTVTFLLILNLVTW